MRTPFCLAFNIASLALPHLPVSFPICCRRKVPLLLTPPAPPTFFSTEVSLATVGHGPLCFDDEVGASEGVLFRGRDVKPLAAEKWQGVAAAIGVDEVVGVAHRACFRWSIDRPFAGALSSVSEM